MQPFGRGAARTGTGATGRSPAPAPGGYPHPPSKLARPRHAETTYQSENTDRKTRKKSMVNSVESVDTGAKNGLDNKEMEMLQLLVRESSIEASREKIKESFTPSEELLKYLHGKYLHPMHQRSTKFPKAKWLCKLCDYHCDNLAKCKEHFLDTRHSRQARSRELETTLYRLPRANKNHLDCLNSLLATVEREQGLSEADMKLRAGVASTVQQLLAPYLPGCSVRLYGSSLSGFGLKSSNVNLDLQISDDQLPHLALLRTFKILKESEEFSDVSDEFTIKIPVIKFTTTITNLFCELSLNNHQAHETSALLADYWALDPRVRTVGAAWRHWASLVRLDRQAEGSLPPHTFPILLVYFLQQQTKPLLPCIHDMLEPGERDAGRYISPTTALAAWRTQNQLSPAELWIELFSFFSCGFKMADLVVSIKRSGQLTNEEKQWRGRRLAVEDPFSSKRNLCRSIQAGSVFDYIQDCLKTGYLYFGTIQTSLGPIITRIVAGEGEDGESCQLPAGCNLESWLGSRGTVLTEAQARLATELVPRNMLSFTFDQALLTNGAVPAVQCMVCGREGHLASGCPDEQLPPLQRLSPPTAFHLATVDSLCNNVARDFRPSPAELRNRDTIMRELSNFIKRSWPQAELGLFGSSSNGFAFRQSDLDISLTFKDRTNASELDCVALIEQLGEMLRVMKGLKNVLAITSAKVPIVKLVQQQWGVEADISLYNVLARENTKLLALYSELDPRCKTLGYMVKLFAKNCGIGDASRGSLSSYAYILMMIFFLQNTSPPVLPVLQELLPPGATDKPQNIVDCWNAWFCEDLARIQQQGGHGGNKASVGELWIQFLDFYAGSWDDRRLVVSIKQRAPLTKFEKMWNSPCIAIEDPFELSHNLGAGISRKMNLYIKKAFIRGRKLFGESLQALPLGYRHVNDYFFDVTLLTDGAPPNDRGCRACGKIGHLVADCPRKKASDNKRKERVKERAKVETGPGEEAQPSEEAQARETPARPRREDTGPAGVNIASDAVAGRPASPPPPPRDASEQGGLHDRGLGRTVSALRGEMPPSGPFSVPPPARSPPQPAAPTPPQSGFDLSALAALTGSAATGPAPALPAMAAINAEDLEASFLTESGGGLGQDSDKARRAPPGFGGNGHVAGPGQAGPPLQQLLGQLGRPAPHPALVPAGGITDQQLAAGGIGADQLRAGGISAEQLRTGAIRPEQLRAGGILPEQLQRGGIQPGQLRLQPGPAPHPGQDPLGLQSLASRSPLDLQSGQLGQFGPLILPMVPFGLPGQVGMMPMGPRPAASHQSGWPPGPAPLPFQPGPSVPPFGFPGRETSGFPSSVLFPADLHHPLLQPQATNPLPIPPAAKPVSPDQILAEGSPMTPPALLNFNFDD